MGRENTIKWLESIEGKHEDEEQESEEKQEATKEWSEASLKEVNQIPWGISDPKQRSWKEAAIYFWQSQKGRELSMGSSIVIALSLTMVGLAMILSEALTEDTDEIVDTNNINGFFIVMYVCSIVAMATLMVLGFFNKLTIDKGHKSHSNSFTKAGLTVLASGGIIYKGLVVAMDGMRPAECINTYATASVVIGALFIMTEVGFIMIYSSIRINFSLPVTLMSRMMLMLIIATNLCIWFRTIIEETLHEIHNQPDKGHSLRVMTKQSPGVMAEESPSANGTACGTNSDGLDTLTSPYLFPLLIEFCVVASTMVLGVWEKSGLGLKVNEKIKKAKHDRIVAFKGVHLKDDGEDEVLETQTEGLTTSGSTTQRDHSVAYQSNSTGFLAGWLVLLTSIVVVLVGLYNAYSSNGRKETLVSVTYSSNLAFTIIGLAALPIAFRQMLVLTHKDNEIKAERHKYNVLGTNLHVPERKVNVARQLDKSLITGTFYALLAFKLLCMIAGYEKAEWVLFCDGLACIFMALLQSTFIAWYAFDKRTTKEEHLATKPGRQVLEFLRLCNLALWLTNTFLLKNTYAKIVLHEVFGLNAWVIISNIVQPLTILYYFHCTMCIAEIIHLCYTPKYIGIVRKSKQHFESPYNSTADLQSTENINV